MHSNQLTSQQLLRLERDTKAHRSYLFKYICHEWGYKRFVPFYPWISSDHTSCDVPERDRDFFELELYLPDSAKRQESPHRLYYRTLFKEYFGGVFGATAPYSNEWILLPRSKYNEFLQIVRRFELHEYSDFLLESICKAQDILDREIEDWESADYQKLKKTAFSEAESLTKIVQKNKDLNSQLKTEKSKLSLGLLKITAVYSNETINISNQFLLSDIKDKFEDILRFWGDGNWKEGAVGFARSFDEYPFKNEFKFKLAKSYYRFLTEKGLFVVANDKPTPNELILCIVRLLEMSLVTISQTEETDEAKIKVVRNWILR